MLGELAAKRKVLLAWIVLILIVLTLYLWQKSSFENESMFMWSKVQGNAFELGHPIFHALFATNWNLDGENRWIFFEVFCGQLVPWLVVVELSIATKNEGKSCLRSILGILPMQLHALGKKGRRETEIEHELQRERSHTPQAKSSRHVVPTTFSTTQWFQCTRGKKSANFFLPWNFYDFIIVWFSNFMTCE